MFFLRFAEAVIANQEVNLVADTKSDPTNVCKPHDLPVHKRMERPISLSSGIDAYILNQDRSNSIDGNILRSLITLGSENSPKSSSSTSPIQSKQPSHSLSISPNESPSTTSPPGGLLYSLLVSNDPQPSSLKQASPRRVREDTCQKIPETSTDLIMPQPKKYKVAEEASDKEGSSRFYPFPRTSSNGSRRFSFGGYSAPRGERIAAILRGPATTPSYFKLEKKSLFNQTTPSASSTKALYSNSTPSILSALISTPCSEWSAGISSASPDSGLDEPLDLTGTLPSSTKHLKPNDTPLLVVQLAKKTARPVQGRISEWLRQASEFVFSSAQTRIPGQDMWLAMFRAIWHRLLALSMAEHSLDVVVVEHAHSGEQQTSGEQILPWLLPMPPISTDAPQLLPDREFAGQLLQCLTELRAQKLSAEEFSILRHAILLTAEQPLALPAMGIKLIQSARLTAPRQKQHPVNENNNHFESSDTDELGFESGLTSLARGLVHLSQLCPFRIAGLFCTHLRGDSSLTLLLPATFRQHHHASPVNIPSTSPNPVRRESILSSLIRSSPIPTTSIVPSNNLPPSSIKSNT